LSGVAEGPSREAEGGPALYQKTLGNYIKDMCEEHVQEQEKKGILPKGKS